MNQIKLLIYFSIVTLFFRCSLIGDDPLVRKEVSDNNISVKWYYYSHITDNSSDFVDVIKDGKSQNIYEANFVVTDISIRGKNIVLKLYNPGNSIVYTENVPDFIYGYKIVLDSSATYSDFNSIPKGIK